MLYSCDILILTLQSFPLALGQSYDFPCSDEAILKDMGKIYQHHTTTKYKSYTELLGFTLPVSNNDKVFASTMVAAGQEIDQ